MYKLLLQDMVHKFARGSDNMNWNMYSKRPNNLCTSAWRTVWVGDFRNKILKMHDFSENFKWFTASKFLNHSSTSKPTAINCEACYFSDKITEKFVEKSEAVCKIQSKRFKKHQKATISQPVLYFSVHNWQQKCPHPNSFQTIWLKRHIYFEPQSLTVEWGLELIKTSLPAAFFLCRWWGRYNHVQSGQ